MTNNDFKKLLDEAIKPLSDAQEEFKKDLNGVKTDLSGVKTDLNGVKADLSGVKKDLTGVKADLDGVKKEQADLRKIIEERVLPPLIYIETTVKSYADRYITNEDHIGRLDKRLKAVEDNLGIQPPQELTISTFE